MTMGHLRLFPEGAGGGFWKLIKLKKYFTMSRKIIWSEKKNMTIAALRKNIDEAKQRHEEAMEHARQHTEAMSSTIATLEMAKQMQGKKKPILYDLDKHPIDLESAASPAVHTNMQAAAERRNG